MKAVIYSFIFAGLLAGFTAQVNAADINMTGEIVRFVKDSQGQCNAHFKANGKMYHIPVAGTCALPAPTGN